MGSNLHMDHDLSLMEDCAVGEVEWDTVIAVPNGDGSWTIKTLWQLTLVEEICPP